MRLFLISLFCSFSFRCIQNTIYRVLFIGFDGMHADALPYVLDADNNTVTGVSGIAELQKAGGVYLAYCGGETDTDKSKSP